MSVQCLSRPVKSAASLIACSLRLQDKECLPKQRQVPSVVCALGGRACRPQRLFQANNGNGRCESDRIEPRHNTNEYLEMEIGISIRNSSAACVAQTQSPEGILYKNGAENGPPEAA